jgi:hypothetical protein
MFCRSLFAQKILSAEVILYYIATHCMLSYNEARQTVMVDMYNRAVQLLPQPTPDRLVVADQFLPESSSKLIKNVY